MSRPTLRQLGYLIALQDAKSFSDAAGLSNVTQSTLSAAILDLEEALQQRLVNRGRKNITLTAFGEETCEAARTILRDVDHLLYRAQAIKSPLCGPLRLGVIPTIAPYFLPHIMPALQESYPELELHLYEDISARLVDKIQHNEIDLALMAFPYKTPDMTQLQLFKEPFFLACPKSKCTIKSSASLNDIDGDQLLLLEDGHCLRDHAAEACKLQIPSTRKAYSATSLQTLIQMVNNGMGITLLPEMATHAPHVPENVNILPFKNPKPMREIGLVWKNNNLRREEFLMLATMIKKRYKTPHEH